MQRTWVLTWTSCVGHRIYSHTSLFVLQKCKQNLTSRPLTLAMNRQRSWNQKHHKVGRNIQNHGVWSALMWHSWGWFYLLNWIQDRERKIHQDLYCLVVIHQLEDVKKRPRASKFCCGSRISDPSEQHYQKDEIYRKFNLKPVKNLLRFLPLKIFYFTQPLDPKQISIKNMWKKNRM